MIAFNKAIIKVNPNFFGMTRKEQDRFKLLNEDAIEFEFKKQAYKHIFNAKIRSEEDILAYDSINMDLKKNMEYAKQCLYFYGIGENYFYFNEPMPFDKYPFEISTIYDFDYHAFFERKNFNKERKLEMNHENYEPYIYGSWARAIFKNPITKKDEIKYLLLESLYVYISFILEDYELEYAQKLIPHNINEIERSNTFKDISFFRELNVGINAYGKEPELNELLKRSSVKRQEIFKELQEQFLSEKNDSIYQIHLIDEMGYPNIHYVFNNVGSMNVSIENWIKDTDKITKKDNSELEEISNYYKLTLKNFMDSELIKIKEEYQDCKIIDFQFINN